MMTDFVKVKHADCSETSVINKEDLILVELIEGEASIFKYANRYDLSSEFTMWYEITREEYDRLCKELGVKDAV